PGSRTRAPSRTCSITCLPSCRSSACASSSTPAGPTCGRWRALLAKAGRPSAGRAEGLIGGQVGAQRLAFVEHEAAALVVRAAGQLEVLEDAAVQLIDMVQADLGHEEGGFLAADAAGAKAHHCLVGQRLAVRQHLIGKLAELVQAPIDGALE